VDAEFVEDLEFFLGHGKSARAGGSVETSTPVSKAKVPPPPGNAEIRQSGVNPWDLD
jgi:hypothetical protein